MCQEGQLRLFELGELRTKDIAERTILSYEVISQWKYVAKNPSFSPPAFAAGELVIFDGELKYIDNKSGHFKAQTRSIQLVLDRLLELGVSSERTQSVMIVAR